MRKYFILIIILACSLASAQNINDVLRYSHENIQGTARFQGMSGAFGALGGDLSSVHLNPAGSAVFENSLITFSGSNYNAKNKASIGNSFLSEASFNSIAFNQIGSVFVFKNSNLTSDWKKLSLAINYDRVQNFNHEIFSSHTTPTGIDEYFLGFAQGIPLAPLLLQDNELIEEAYLNIGASLGFAEQQAFLGIFGGIIDAVDPNNDENTDYETLTKYTNNTAVNQNYRKRSSGFNDKYTFNLAQQYTDNLYFGASLNFNSIFSDQLTQISEKDYDVDSPVQFATFDNFLRTRGSAFSFSLGTIVKLNNNVRIGGSYQSPTWYRLHDEFSQRINSTLADIDINFIDFNVANLYQRYTIKTPGKATGSLALVFGADGLLSIDYGYQDMSQAELRPATDAVFSSENTLIRNQLQPVSSLRLGGEYRIKKVSLRAGYRYEQSPYVNKTIGNLNGISGGFGYNFGPSKLDFAINTYTQNYQESVLIANPSTSLTIDRNTTNATLSYTINF